MLPQHLTLSERVQTQHIGASGRSQYRTDCIVACRNHALFWGSAILKPLQVTVPAEPKKYHHVENNHMVLPGCPTLIHLCARIECMQSVFQSLRVGNPSHESPSLVIIILTIITYRLLQLFRVQGSETLGLVG